MIDRRTLLKSGAAAIVAAGIAPACGSTPSTPDAVIIGGGFAGVTAARELSFRGRRAVLVEARDRLGGRTHTADLDGHALELGGTWVHPVQPNVWAEITRYGLEVEAMPVPGGSQAILSAGQMTPLDEAAMMQAFDALAQFCAPGAALYPAPYSGTWGPDLEHYGDRSMREHLASMQLPPLMRDVLDAMCTSYANAPLDRAAASELMRVYALAGYSPVQMFAALSGTKLASGTRALVEAIASQAKLAEIRLRSPVRRVTQTGDGVRVELVERKRRRDAHRADHAADERAEQRGIRARLSEVKRAAASERHAGSGVKCYAHVKGDVGNVSVFAPEAEAINFAATIHHGATGSLLVVFGDEPKRLPFGDVAAMQAGAAPVAAGGRGRAHLRLGLGRRPVRARHLVRVQARSAGPAVARAAPSRRSPVLRERRLGRRVARLHRRRDRERVSRRARDRRLPDRLMGVRLAARHLGAGPSAGRVNDERFVPDSPRHRRAIGGYRSLAASFANTRSMRSTRAT